jgi:hypothetical protein
VIGPDPGGPRLFLIPSQFGALLLSSPFKQFPLFLKRGLRSCSLRRRFSSSHAPFPRSGAVFPVTSSNSRQFTRTRPLSGCLRSCPYPFLFCITLLTNVLSPLTIGWHTLPLPPGPNGTGNKRHCCAACLQSLSRTPNTLRCSFSGRGFSSTSGTQLQPCRTAYHSSCISVGFPFTSRRRHQAGLSFPSVSEWPNFICESCTVRSVVNRELTGPADWKLLCLERMQLIDMAHYWALNTHKTYRNKLSVLRNFEHHFGFRFLQPTVLLWPPSGPEIPLMWCQEAYSLRSGSSRRAAGDETLTLAFSTIRALRSAAS